MKIIWEPNPGPQCEFLQATAREVLYGGAVGGGKTDALGIMQLRWADHPKHRGILLRRKEDRLREIIDRAREWYLQAVPGTVWNETRLRFEFPSGAKVHMGHAEQDKDIDKFLSFEFNLVCFDELTEFTKRQYQFMLSRNRTKSDDLPAQMRNGTNPGGEGMNWVDDRFLKTRPEGGQEYVPYQVYKHQVKTEKGPMTLTRQFIPSTVFDNPKLPNRDEYIAGLADMDPVEREAYLYGRWGHFRGKFFPKPLRLVPPGIKHPDWYVIRAMDYGWADPTAILWGIVYPKLHQIEIAAEIYAKQLTVDDIAALIMDTESALRIGSHKIVHSVLSPDAFKGGSEGAPGIATNLDLAGAWFERAVNDRIGGWAQVLRLIARDQISVWEGRCPNLVRTLPKLARDVNDSRDVKKRQKEDHAPEALRYMCMAFHENPDITPIRDPRPVDNRHKDPFYDKLRSQLLGTGGRGVMPGLGSGW